MRRLPLLLVVLLAALATAGMSAPAAAAVPTGPVVVVGVTGLRWQDVGPAMPGLQALLRRGAVGALSVRTAATRDCRADAWLTLGAGDRLRAARRQPASCPDTVPDPSVLPRVRADARRLRSDAAPGALAAALRSAGSCVSATGLGAVLAAGGPGPGPCPVRLVDAGVVHPGAGRPAELAAADAVLLAAVGPGSTVLVVGTGGTGAEREHLQVAVAAGPGFGRGALVSASTRRSPYVQLIDVAPTVLQLRGLRQPASMAGQPWRSTGAAPSRAALVDLDRLAGEHRTLAPWFFVGLVTLQALVYAVGWRTGRSVRVPALALAAAPGAGFLANLVPWWRSGAAALVLAVLAVDLLMLALALAGPWRTRPLGPPGAVCGLTAVVVGADLLTGAHLQIDTMAGYSPLVAGRFAGIGNLAFGALGTAALLATAALVAHRSRRTTAVLCVLAGLATVAVDGSPSWGSDVGGVLALVPGFAVLTLVATGARISLPRLAAAVLGAVAVVAAFGLLDHARPPDRRTHLGRFVDQVLHGGAGTVLGRKAAADLGLLLHSPLTAVVPLLAAAAAALVLRPPPGLAALFRAAPTWRAGLLAALVTAVTGFLTNDSGVAVLALALAVGIPAAVAAAQQSRRPRTR